VREGTRAHIINSAWFWVLNTQHNEIKKKREKDMMKIFRRKPGVDAKLFIFLLFSCVFMLISPALVSVAQADRSFTVPTFTPDVVYTGIPTKVRVAVTVGYDPKLLPASINLLQVKTAGSVVLARMYDDGTHGDITVNDERYTVEITINEPNTTELIFRVSAAYKGEMRRVLSDPFTLKVLQFPDLEGIWNRFVTCMVNKDLDGALLYMTDTGKRSYSVIFPKVGLDKVSANFQSVRDFQFIEISPTEAEYSFMGLNRGVMSKGRVIFWFEGSGIWRINYVGF
jgi:hypothetical protein